MRKRNHPYVTTSPETHGHFLGTNLRHPPFSADAIPFRWMRKPTRWFDSDKPNEIDFRDKYDLGRDPILEPELKVEKGWLQQLDNHAGVLDCFHGHIKETESLCFLYAKRTPLSEDSRRVIIGVGRVNHKGENKEYQYSVPEKAAPLRAMLWERLIQHSIRPLGIDGVDGFEGGFLLPYYEAEQLAAENPEFDFEGFRLQKRNAISHRCSSGVFQTALTCPLQKSPCLERESRLWSQVEGEHSDGTRKCRSVGLVRC